MFKKIISIVSIISIVLSLAVFSTNADSIIDPTKTCSITVHKFIADGHIAKMREAVTGIELNPEDIDPDFKPLAGVVFKATLLNADGSKTQTVYTFDKTNADGVATISGLAHGVYYVEEVTDTSKVASSAIPATVALPLTNAFGNGWVYDAHVYPKNEDVQICKDVTHLGNDHHTADINEDETWIVTSDIPDDIAPIEYTFKDGKKQSLDGYKKYEIVDEIDSRLQYTSTTKVVAVSGSKSDVEIGTETALTENTDYTITVNGQKLTYALTQAGMKKISPYNGTVKATKIRIYFVTHIKDTITESDLGVEIPNDVKLLFTNSFNEDGERVSDVPEVHTAGIKIFKYDADTNKPLKGAKFKIATSLENANNGIFVQRDGADYELTSDENGYLLFKGLSYGTKASKYNDMSVKGTLVNEGETKYYIVETQAPMTADGDSYQLSVVPIEVKANSVSHLSANAVKVSNTPPVIILTGGVGSTLFVVGILLAVMGAAGIFIVKKNKTLA